MAITTDDCDIRDVKMYMEAGGNGDFYINLIEYNEVGVPLKYINYRMAMSGSNIPLEVRLAFVNLFRLMEKNGLNEHPCNHT